LGILAGGLGLLWLAVFNQLRLEWTINPLYAYGWTIPFLSGYLLYERWRSAPAPGGQVLKPLAIGLIVASLLAFLPVRVVQEANPDWILISWAMTGLAALITLSTLYLFGGWRWVLHFGFPVLFIFTAVPWPVNVENAILQNLMLAQAAMTAEVLIFSGVVAEAVGNIVYISVNGQTVPVGVEEACSGIRSLQTAFMMSLFLGEFYRLGAFSRLGLVGASFALAFIFNFGRTYALTWIGGFEGMDALDRWHDPLGYIVLGLCVGGLWLLALLFARLFGTAKADQRDTAGPPVPTMPLLGRMPLAVFIFMAGWLVAAEAGTEAWYRSQETRMREAPDWRMDWPSQAADYREHEFSERTRTILKYDSGASRSWTGDDLNEWSAYYLRWYPGRVSKNLARAHHPDICLPAAGLEHVNTFDEPVLVEINEDLTLPFTAYLFEKPGGMHQYVFHTIYEDRHKPGGPAVADYGALTREDRISQALSGIRNQGQRVLGISVTGPLSLEIAKDELRQTLKQVVVTD